MSRNTRETLVILSVQFVLAAFLLHIGGCVMHLADGKQVTEQARAYVACSAAIETVNDVQVNSPGLCRESDTRIKGELSAGAALSDDATPRRTVKSERTDASSRPILFVYSQAGCSGCEKFWRDAKTLPLAGVLKKFRVERKTPAAGSLIPRFEVGGKKKTGYADARSMVVFLESALKMQE